MEYSSHHCAVFESDYATFKVESQFQPWVVLVSKWARKEKVSAAVENKDDV